MVATPSSKTAGAAARRAATREAAREAAIDRAVALHAEAERRREGGDHRGAAACARQSVALFQQHEGAAHPDVAAARLELGAALELADEWADALAEYTRG